MWWEDISLGQTINDLQSYTLEQHASYNPEEKAMQFNSFSMSVMLSHSKVCLRQSGLLDAGSLQVCQ